MKQEKVAIIVALAMATMIGLSFGFGTELAQRITNNPPNTSRVDYSSKDGQSKSPQPSAAGNDAGGVEQLNQYKCYSHESVGECAARVVQNRVVLFYVILAAVGALQAGVGFITWLLLREQLFAGQAQVRAYIVVSEVTVAIVETLMNGIHYSDEPHYVIKVTNSGNSPALRFRYFATTYFLSANPNYRPHIRKEDGFGPAKWGYDIPSRETAPFRHMGIAARLNEEDLVEFTSGRLQVLTTLHLIFTDVFGKDITGEYNFRAHFTQDRLRAEMPMVAWQSTAAEMAAIGDKRRKNAESSK